MRERWFRVLTYLVVIIDVSFEIPPSPNSDVGLPVGKAANPVLQWRVFLGGPDIDNPTLAVDDDSALNSISNLLAGVIPGDLGILHVSWCSLAGAVIAPMLDRDVSTRAD